VAESPCCDPHRWRLNRFLARMLQTPPWDLEGVKPLTDEEMLLFQGRY